jgi:SAM-dependent methyltransferase
MQWLRKRRGLIERDLQTIDERSDLSPVFLAQQKAVTPALRRFAHGRVIDIGCGTAPFAGVIAGQVALYHGLDRWPRSDKTVLAGDVQNMGMIGAGSYDVALLFEVLEHVPDPWQALAEINRILAPDGVLIMTVPHLSRLHDVPYDFYRYTRYGIEALMAGAGFTVVELREKAGLFTFLGHQVSTVLVSVAWTLPAIRKLAWFINRWLVTRPCYQLDQLLPGLTALFPLGYLVVARKTSEAEKVRR